MYTNEDNLEQSVMNNFDSVGYVADRDMIASEASKDLVPLFFLVDTSGSMGAERKIEQVAEAMENIAATLREANSTNPDAVVKVSILCFDDIPKWVTVNQDPDQMATTFNLGGLTSMGAAFQELEKKLSREKLIEKGVCSGYKRAVIILLSDGGATDNVNEGISKLMLNHWFTKAMRFAFAIGENADINCLEAFTGHPKTVLRVDVNTEWSKLLAKVAHVASSTATHGLSNGEDPVQQAQREKNFRDAAMDAAEILASISGSLADPDTDSYNISDSDIDPNDPFSGAGFVTNTTYD